MSRYLSQAVVTVACGFMVLYFAACGPQNDNNTVELAATDSIVAPAIATLYGLPIDSFEIENHRVSRNERLTHVLAKGGLSMQEIFEIDRLAKPTYSFNNMRAGNSYSLFFSNDTLRSLKYFVYEIDKMSYVRCKIESPFAIELIERQITTKEVKAGAAIESSLWNATLEQGLPPMLSVELSDIFAWTVDFFGIEKGDYFKVIYDESYTDTVRLGVDQIKAALFMHRGTPYYAFRYDRDTTHGFYDLEGNSLRKAFLKAPLKYSRVSSRFSNGRMHPVLRIRRPHHGVDYAAPSGTPVLTIGDGKVIAKGWDKKGGGNYVKIRHNSVYTTVYMHLRGFAKGLKVGQSVRQGDLIGYVGSTGMSTGPHLDFRVYMNGKAVDPLKMEAPPATPIDNDQIQSFINLSDSIRPLLDGIEIGNKQ